MRKVGFGISLFSAFVLLSGWGGKDTAEEPTPYEVDVPSACDLVAGNLVQNCGFETGTLANWTTDAGLIFVSSGATHTGNFGLSAGPVGTLGYLTQNIVTGGGMHHLSFWILNPPNSQPSELTVSWEGNVIYDSVNLPPFDYMRLDFDVFACGASSELKFGFRQDPDYFAFDDVVLVPSP